MLIGFTIVAAPLLFAIVNAAVQMNRLSIRSQQLVVHGMQGTRNNQRMFEEIEALDRQARLYQVTGSANLLDAYAQHHSRLLTATHELLTLPLDEASQDGVRAVESKADQLLQDLRRAAPNAARSSGRAANPKINSTGTAQTPTIPSATISTGRVSSPAARLRETSGTR